VICNRFATAKFEMNLLLDDCKELLDRAARALAFPREMNAFLIDYFIGEFQLRAANKILQNPARFTFSNAMIWNGFLTAVESDLKLSLPRLREVVLALNMAPNIAKNPEIAREICPNLPMTTIGFVIMMFVPDEAFANPLDPMGFMEACGVFSLPSEVSLDEPEVGAFERMRTIDFGRWSDTKVPAKIAQRFPFLKNYATG